MKKLNCWEFKKCGKGPGAENTSEQGVCPAAIEVRADKINDGKNAGRACWAIAGTLCRGIVDGKFTAKVNTCMLCDFYKQVCQEQGEDFQGAAVILDKLKEKA